MADAGGGKERRGNSIGPGSVTITKKDLTWAASLLVSVAVTWGTMQANVDGLKVRVARVEGKIEAVARIDATLVQINDRLGRIETYIDRSRDP